MFRMTATTLPKILVVASCIWAFIKPSSAYFVMNLQAKKNISGCNAKSAPLDGKHRLMHKGLDRVYTTISPEGYKPDSPRSVIFAFHPFSSKAEYMTSFLSVLSAKPDGPIVVAPEGISMLGLPSGWNGAGSTESPGPLGETCQPGTVRYSCHVPTCGLSACLNPSQRCWWTSCADDVGFTLSVLEAVESSYCVQRDHIFATGFSAGGQFLFELASDPRSASRFNAVFPLHGLPHAGFLRAPPTGGSVPRLFGIWAGVNATFQDPQYPPISNMKGKPDMSNDVAYGPQGGYFYSTEENTTAFWGRLHCARNQDAQAGEAATFAQSFHDELTCVGRCSGRVISCRRSTDVHEPPSYAPELMWHFFLGEGAFHAGARRS